MTHQAPLTPEEPLYVSGGPDFDMAAYQRDMVRYEAAKAEFGPFLKKANMGSKMNPENRKWYGTSGPTDTKYSYDGPLLEDAERIRKVFGADLSPERVIRIFRMQDILTYVIEREKGVREDYEDLSSKLRSWIEPILGHIVDEY